MLRVGALKLVPAADLFTPGQRFVGTFQVTRTLGKDKPVTVVVFGKPNGEQIVQQMLSLDCQLFLLPAGKRPPKFLRLGWIVKDVNGVVLDDDSVDVKVKPDGTCKHTEKALGLSGIPPGGTGELIFMPVRKPLRRGTGVTYDVGVL